MSKYYKQKTGNIVLKWISDNPNDKECFKGKVLVKSVYVEVGEISNDWIKASYTPYTPTPQELAEWGETETVTNDNPKDIAIQPTDVEIRLRCLEMACERLMDTIFASEDIVIEAQEFYDWITKKD